MRKRRRNSLKEGQFAEVEFSNGKWLGMDGGMVRYPKHRATFESTEEANRWAATSSFSHLKKTGERFLWRLNIWYIGDTENPIFVTPYVTLDEAVLWAEQQMLLHPELFGLPQAPKGGK